MAEPWIRRTVEGYRLVSLLGEGLWSAVFLGVSESTGRKVAVKVAPLFSQDAWDQTVAAFHRYDAVRHPGLVTLFDLRKADGRAIVMMEALAGETLSAALSRGVLAPAVVRQLGLDLTAALLHLHDRRLFHGRVKPSSVVLTAQGARLVGLPLVPGAAAVSPDAWDWMAPELQQGGSADAPADVYALGLTLLAALSGGLVHGPREVALSAVPDARLAAVIADCLRPAPARRPSLGLVQQRLQALALSATPGLYLVAPGTATGPEPLVRGVPLPARRTAPVSPPPDDATLPQMELEAPAVPPPVWEPPPEAPVTPAPPPLLSPLLPPPPVTFAEVRAAPGAEETAPSVEEVNAPPAVAPPLAPNVPPIDPPPDTVEAAGPSPHGKPVSVWVFAALGAVSGLAALALVVGVVLWTAANPAALAPTSTGPAVVEAADTSQPAAPPKPLETTVTLTNGTGQAVHLECTGTDLAEPTMAALLPAEVWKSPTFVLPMSCVALDPSSGTVWWEWETDSAPETGDGWVLTLPPVEVERTEPVRSAAPRAAPAPRPAPPPPPEVKEEPAAPPKATLRVDATSDKKRKRRELTVRIDGRSFGEVPVVASGLSVGSHRVEASRRGESVSCIVDLSDGGLQVEVDPEERICRQSR